MPSVVRCMCVRCVWTENSMVGGSLISIAAALLFIRIDGGSNSKFKIKLQVNRYHGNAVYVRPFIFVQMRGLK